jgi:hypothetical protein
MLVAAVLLRCVGVVWWGLVQSVECCGAILCLLDDGLPFVKRVLNSASSRMLPDSVVVLEGKQPKPQCVCLSVLACTGRQLGVVAGSAAESQCRPSESL